MGFSAEVSVPMHELKGIFTALSIIRFWSYELLNIIEERQEPG
jgi:hypothetical protein